MSVIFRFDARSKLCSSANLTEFAFNLNMELGVLIKGGPLPGAATKKRAMAHHRNAFALAAIRCPMNPFHIARLLIYLPHGGGKSPSGIGLTESPQ